MIPIRHLYLHAPFCRGVCPYCSYAVESGDGSSSQLDRWVSSLAGEMKLREEGALLGSPLRTLQVGGGTPSLFGSEAMWRIRTLLGRERLDGIEEWTVEVNPEDLSVRLLQGWIGAGVTRINLGLQSFRPSALNWLGRLHDGEHGKAGAARLADSGIPAWGVDLLFGLPPAVDPDPLPSVETAVSIGVPHISLYELSLEGERGEANALPDEEEKAEQYLRIVDFLLSEGYEGYEMTSFALPGHRSAHAVAILEGESYLGLGPAAESRIGGRRSWNQRDWQGYSDRVERGELPEEGGEVLGDDECYFDRVWSKLKLREGLPLEELSEEGRKVAVRWVREGNAFASPGRVSLTPEGWLRLDGLALELARTKVQGEPRKTRGI